MSINHIVEISLRHVEHVVVEKKYLVQDPDPGREVWGRRAYLSHGTKCNEKIKNAAGFPVAVGSRDSVGPQAVVAGHVAAGSGP